VLPATNRLDGLGTPQSRLRLDLFHRVATVVVALPPLRDRPGDIRELALLMIADLAPQFGMKHVSPQAWSALSTYDWPGNVRELSDAVSRAMALGGETLGPLDFLPEIAGMRSAPIRALNADGTASPELDPEAVFATGGPLPASASL